MGRTQSSRVKDLMNHRFHDAEWTRNYVETVNERRPERVDMFEHVADCLGELTADPPTVVELAPGPGMLAEVVLNRFRDLSYIGVDYSAPFIELARKTLASFEGQVTLHQADLNEDDWSSLISGPVHAVISNMAIHDLGSEAAVTTTYEKASRLLEPNGLLINADLVTRPEDDLPPTDGKLKVPRHLEVLTTIGFIDARCTRDLGHYACIVARKCGS